MELFAHEAGIAVTLRDEGQAALYGGGDLVEVLPRLSFQGTPLFAESGYLGLELGDEDIDQVLVAEQDVLEASKHAILKLRGLDTDNAVTGAPFPLGRAVVALAVDDGHGTATTSALHQAGQQPVSSRFFVWRLLPHCEA